MESAVTVLQEYREEVDGIYALHVDACAGFHRFRQELRKQSTDKSLPPASERTMFFGDGDPNLASSTFQHVTTVQHAIDRNEKGGINERRLRQACIVFAYMHWEDHARGDLATALGIHKNDIKSPVFADLGKYRHAVAHNKGVLTKQPEVLCTFQKGDEVVFDRPQFNELMRELLQELERLALEYIGVSIQFPFDRRLSQP